jgi:hypothetical protein
MTPYLLFCSLFILHEAAIRALYAKGLVRPDVDALAGLPDSLVYADDTDFVSLSREYLDPLLEVLGPIFKNDFDSS